MPHDKKPLSAFAARQAQQSKKTSQRVKSQGETEKIFSGKEDSSVALEESSSISVQPRTAKRSARRDQDGSHKKNTSRASKEGQGASSIKPEAQSAQQHVSRAAGSASLSSLDKISENESDQMLIDTSSEHSHDGEMSSTYVADTLLSTVANNQVTQLGQAALKVVLHQGDEIALLGQYTLWVSRGFVSVMGALLAASSKIHTVFAPSTHALPVIKFVKAPGDSTSAFAEIILESTHNGLRGLGRLHPSLQSIWNSQSGDDSSFMIISRSRDDRNGHQLERLEENREWPAIAMKIIKRVHQKPIIMITGPKGSGKSSFGRYLTNRILTFPRSDEDKIDGLSFLDLDPGQPEYSPPGVLSLVQVREPNLGPPFSHPLFFEGENITVTRSHYLGETTPANDVAHYLACARDLVSRLHRNKLVIINACGWTHGAGIEIIEELLRSIPLTDIVLLSNTNTTTPSPIPEYEAAVTNIALHKAAIHYLPYATHQGRSARDLRLMQSMSYFHAEEPIEGQRSWTYEPLFRHSSQTISYGDEGAHVQGIVVYGNRMNPALLPTLINGSVLALVEIEDTHILPSEADENIAPHANHLPYVFLGGPNTCDPLPPSSSRLVAQVLVRAIDIRSKTLQVLAPLTLSPMLDAGRTLVLVHGRQDAPSWAYTEAYYEAQSRARAEAAWRAFRRAEIHAAGGSITADGIRGPNGEDWTGAEPLDMLVPGEAELLVEPDDAQGGPSTWDMSAWLAAQPWVELPRAGPGVAGERSWRVRRNLGTRKRTEAGR